MEMDRKCISCLITLFMVLVSQALSSSSSLTLQRPMSNAIDNCWRRDPHWERHRTELANCAVGFGSAAYGGKGGKIYTVTTPDDNAADPLPGSLRYGVTRGGPLWIVFAKDMNIKLEEPLFISSHKTIDGRGAHVEISHGPCIRIWNVTNVIVHGLHIHHCYPSGQGEVMISDSFVLKIRPQDGDAVSVSFSKNIWIDHNTFSRSSDGLIDVTQASTAITISNNRFSYHDKVMLLGNSDDFVGDKYMKVTVAYNHFGPALMQRMPRCRRGYVHVANNEYEPWGIYAIGGSMNPTIISEGNRFVAPDELYKKQVTWREGCSGSSCDNGWVWKSVKDSFINGAYFVPSGAGSKAISLYRVWEKFKVGRGRWVRSMTRNAGALDCRPNMPCIGSNY